MREIHVGKIKTSRLKVTYREREGGDRVVLFVHGNLSSSIFWETTMQELPEDVTAYAVDLRGFGGTKAREMDATEGVNVFAEDIGAFVEAMEISSPLHLVGWSLGGGVVMQYAINRTEEVASMTLIAPMSPYGFGGTKGERGERCYQDSAGSGGGTANQEFIKLLKERYRGSDHEASPRNIMNRFLFKAPFRLDPEREETLLDGLLETEVGEGLYPGNSVPSANWPGVAPGDKGVNNTISPKYLDLQGLLQLDPKPPVLWIRGSDDVIVSDTSLLDLGYLGQVGAVPGWPGPEVFPPQPMVTQIRRFLDSYRERGGEYREVVFEDCGHSPHIERPEEFKEAFYGFLRG